MPPARKPNPIDPDPLEKLLGSAHPAGWVPEPIDVPLLNLEEESRLTVVRARVHNGHASHSDARFLLELLDRYRT
jgi:hypothetical protein